MTTIETAWREFSEALTEARELFATGAETATLQDVLKRAPDLLKAVDEELAANGDSIQAEDRNALEYLRAELAKFEIAPNH